MLSLLQNSKSTHVMLDLQRHIPAADTHVGSHQSSDVVKAGGAPSHPSEGRQGPYGQGNRPRVIGFWEENLQGGGLATSSTIPFT